MMSNTSVKSLSLSLLLACSCTSGFQTVPLATRQVSVRSSSSQPLFSTFKTKEEQAATTKTTSAKERNDNNGVSFPLEAPKPTFDLSQEIATSSSSSDVTTATTTNEDDDNSLEGLLWRGVVVILCALWASNFPVAKLVMAEPGVDSSLYALARFGVSALALAPGAIASTRRTGMDWDTFKGAVTCGSFVAFGYLGQTLGLLTTTASKSCVICSLHCVFVAIVAEWMRVNRAQEAAVTMPGDDDIKDESTNFDFKRLIPAAIAVAGVAVVELKGAAGGANIGDLLSFAQPIGFGLGYLLLEDLMSKRPEAALAVSAIKLGVVACFSFLMFELSPLLHGGSLNDLAFAVPDFGAILASPVAMGGILYTGLVTTALALWVESIAFARVPATDASLILTTEPLFAAGLGAVTLGETFGLSDYAGASLIIGACVLATLMDDENREEDCDPESDTCEAPRKTPMIGN